MSDLNVVIIKGRLTKDCEVRTIPSGKTVTTFTIATNKTWKQDGEKKQKVCFIDCTAWGTQGDIIAKYFKRGSAILLRADLEQDTWESDGKKMSKHKLTVQDFDFVDKAGQPTDEPKKLDTDPVAVQDSADDSGFPF